MKSILTLIYKKNIILSKKQKIKKEEKSMNEEKSFSKTSINWYIPTHGKISRKAYK